MPTPPLNQREDSDLPAPPVPADADLKNFPFTPIYRARLFGSSFHARVSDSEWRAGVTLWLKSQDQRPAGSLPDDDVDLCRLAELGRDMKTWMKLKAGALHGWYLCNDGRLYHSTVAETVLGQLDGKAEQRQRTLKGRIANLEKRLSQATDDRAKSDMAAQLQKLRQELSQAPAISVTEPVTGVVTGTNRDRREQKGEGREREGKGLVVSNDTPGFAEWYAAYPRKVARGAAAKAYRTALKKTDAATLLAGVQRYARECAGKDPRYVAHPATWLSSERWADDATDPELRTDHISDEEEAEIYRGAL